MYGDEEVELTAGHDRNNGRGIGTEASESRGGLGGEKDDGLASESTPAGDSMRCGRGDGGSTGIDRRLDRAAVGGEGDSEHEKDGMLSIEEGEGVTRGAARDSNPVLLHKPRLMQ